MVHKREYICVTDNAKAGQGLSVGSVIEYITLEWRPLA